MSAEDPNAANKKKDAAVEGITYQDLKWPGNAPETPTDQAPPENQIIPQTKPETSKPQTDVETTAQ
jgi:hypothetical protein